MWENAIRIKLSLIHHYNIHIIQNDLHLGTLFLPLHFWEVYSIQKKRPERKESTDLRSNLSSHLLHNNFFSNFINFFINTLTIICITIFSKCLLQPNLFGKCLLKALRILFFETPVVRVNHIIYSKQLSSVQLWMFFFNPPGSPLLLPTHFVGKKKTKILITQNAPQYFLLEHSSIKLRTHCTIPSEVYSSGIINLKLTSLFDLFPACEHAGAGSICGILNTSEVMCT